MLCLSVAPQFPCCRGNFIIVCMPAATTRGRLLHMAVYISSMSHKLSLRVCSHFSFRSKSDIRSCSRNLWLALRLPLWIPPGLAPFLFSAFPCGVCSNKFHASYFYGGLSSAAALKIHAETFWGTGCGMQIGCGFLHGIRAETSFGSDVCE